MLVEFTVGNYLSFRKDATLSLVGTRLTSENSALDEGAFRRVSADLSVLHTAVIYGANGSGKSNLILALGFMLRFIQDSGRAGQSDDLIPVVPFLFDEDSREEPSYFELVFLRDGVQYRYGFEADQYAVRKEWLYRKNKRETLLFERRGQEFPVLKGEFKDTRLITENTRKEALFLSVCAQLNSKYAQGLLEHLRTKVVVLGEGHIGHSFTAECVDDGRYHGKILELLRGFDLGVSDFKTELQRIAPANLPIELPEEIRKDLEGRKVWDVTTVHPKFDHTGTVIGYQELSLRAESAGTQKLFAFAGPLVDILEKGIAVVIDEFDVALHPLISQKIIGLFHDPEVNQHGAQLIIATHDTNLIHRRILRRDEIWFVEKSGEGASSLYSLASFRPRKDASLGRDYFRGKFGAIPFLGGLDLLSWGEEANEL